MSSSCSFCCERPASALVEGTSPDRSTASSGATPWTARCCHAFRVAAVLLSERWPLPDPCVPGLASFPFVSSGHFHLPACCVPNRVERKWDFFFVREIEKPSNTWDKMQIQFGEEVLWVFEKCSLLSHSPCGFWYLTTSDLSFTDQQIKNLRCNKLMSFEFEWICCKVSEIIRMAWSSVSDCAVRKWIYETAGEHSDLIISIKTKTLKKRWSKWIMN